MNIRKLTYTLSVALAACVAAHGQEKADDQPVNQARNEEPISLPAFEIRSEKDAGLVGTSSLSSTRVAVDLSELPQSVKVLNSSFLEAVRPTMMSDVLNYVGGGQSGALNWTPGRMNIRGFTGDADYMDGFSPSQGSTVDPMIFDRFEVIKGPSSIFLAADGSPGGILNKITKSPQGTAKTTLSVTVGLFDANHIGIDTTGPITKDKKLQFRLVAGETYSDAYYKNAYMHRFTAMPALSYQFNENTKLEIKGELVEVNWPSYNGLPIDPRTGYMFDLPYDTSMDENAPLNWRHDNVHRVWGSFNTRPTNWLAISIRGMRAFDRSDRVESIPAPWAEGSRTWASAAVAPATYNGGAVPRSTTADDAHNLYNDIQADLNFNYTAKWFTEYLLVGSESRDNPTRTETYSGKSSSSPWYPYGGAPGPATVNVSAVPSAYTANQSLFQRVYALETLKLFNDRLIGNFGVNRAKVYGSSYNYLAGTNFVPFTIYKNLVQWGVLYKALPGVSVFTGYNQNFAANGVGTFNGVPNTPLPPKLGEQHEVGLKFDMMNHAITANIAYFDINQKNNTVPSFPLDPTNPNILIPGVISRGFDADFSWKVNRDLFVMATFANYKAKSVLGPAVDGRYVQPGTGSVAYGSIPVNNTAEHTASIFGQYSFHGQLNGVSVGLGANYLSHRAVTDGPNQVFWGYIPARTLVNAIIGWKQNRHITYTLNVDNVLDQKYIYSVRSENIWVPGTPINVKLTMDYTF